MAAIFRIGLYMYTYMEFSCVKPLGFLTLVLWFGLQVVRSNGPGLLKYKEQLMKTIRSTIHLKCKEAASLSASVLYSPLASVVSSSFDSLGIDCKPLLKRTRRTRRPYSRTSIAYANAIGENWKSYPLLLFSSIS